ncbi:MAG: hypothetical protein JWL73_2390 [Actinomycetia bacterium]|nr:hypothetical protein [Actinomycetes bacterium]
MQRQPLSRYALAAVMAGAGLSHFVVPRYYERIVPRALGHEHLLVQASGVAEIGCATLLANRRTTRIGGWATVVLLLAVFPANVQMALDGGVADASFPANSAAASWARLPLQVPLIWWAATIARAGAPSSSVLSGRR